MLLQRVHLRNDPTHPSVVAAILDFYLVHHSGGCVCTEKGLKSQGQRQVERTRVGRRRVEGTASVERS
jgi:hypothetical protein